MRREWLLRIPGRKAVSPGVLVIAGMMVGAIVVGTRVQPTLSLIVPAGQAGDPVRAAAQRFAVAHSAALRLYELPDEELCEAARMAVAGEPWPARTDPPVDLVVVPASAYQTPRIREGACAAFTPDTASRPPKAIVIAADAGEPQRCLLAVPPRTAARASLRTAFVRTLARAESRNVASAAHP